MRHFDLKTLLISLVENSRRRLTRSRAVEAIFIRIALTLVLVLSFYLSLQSPASAADEAIYGSAHSSLNPDRYFDGGEGMPQAVHADIDNFNGQGKLEKGFFEAENAAVFGKPDLTVSISKIRTKEKNGVVQLEFQIEVKNIGDGIAEGRVTILAAISSKDLPPMVITDLQAGTSTQFKYKRHFRRDLAGRTILLRVDSENNIPEMNEDNNQSLSMIP